ncbi:hypothetical protein DQ04_19191010, partial [Trypanosoma grayi]|uniref:hypothetical protein n=1 Tax=Trypanosoma grayi TaxID=71804 RepID=UPI0004F4AADA
LLCAPLKGLAAWPPTRSVFCCCCVRCVGRHQSHLRRSSSLFVSPVVFVMGDTFARGRDSQRHEAAASTGDYGAASTAPWWGGLLPARMRGAGGLCASGGCSTRCGGPKHRSNESCTDALH